MLSSAVARTSSKVAVTASAAATTTARAHVRRRAFFSTTVPPGLQRMALGPKAATRLWVAAAANPSWQPHRMTAFRSVFIQTMDTPNPESLKFIPTGVPVLVNEEGNGYYVTANDPKEEILRSPLAKALLMDPEKMIKSVYLGADFITVTKYAEYKWKVMRPRVFEIIMEWVDSGQPALLDEPLVTDTTILDDDDEVVAMIKELIEVRIRPAVQEDGGDIRYVAFDETTGGVTVQLAGSCVGCPSSSVTLKQGVENMLKHYIPEVTFVFAVDEEGNDALAVKEKEEELPVDTKDQKQKTYEERLAAAGIPFSN
jgi:NFU1 iron-sulfur cluster scaffold homolog, mitochondrial